MWNVNLKFQNVVNAKLPIAWLIEVLKYIWNAIT